MIVQTLDFKAIWDGALGFQQFATEAEHNQKLWEGVYRNTKIPRWALETLNDHAETLRLLIIAEDWCGDAANTVPVLAKLGDEAENMDVRIIKRDENLHVMDRYLTNGARSIPIAILLDSDFTEIGHWGPRPKELQQWVVDNKDTIPKEKRYPLVRRWYAKDKGESTLREVLGLL